MARRELSFERRHTARERLEDVACRCACGACVCEPCDEVVMSREGTLVSRRSIHGAVVHGIEQARPRVGPGDRIDVELDRDAPGRDLALRVVVTGKARVAAAGDGVVAGGRARVDVGVPRSREHPPTVRQHPTHISAWDRIMIPAPMTRWCCTAFERHRMCASLTVPPGRCHHLSIQVRPRSAFFSLALRPSPSRAAPRPQECSNWSRLASPCCARRGVPSPSP
jgi:hypothetical protein